MSRCRQQRSRRHQQRSQRRQQRSHRRGMGQPRCGTTRVTPGRGAADWATQKTSRAWPNQIGTERTIPASSRGSVILPIFKCGDKSSAKNYHLVALIDNEAKYFSGTILMELTFWASEKAVIPPD
ncbi:hypothetical protein NDU88_005364 [Pleurodeles waltl]|uniref:Uncharacterized protein n=1 Tax=Pleurodeles waltl TaxID=8319 RepID=A0AAV7MY53_PLEWA|nr:hypothetical protein NDU88_005364 [Pleurodeles waltl]